VRSLRLPHLLVDPRYCVGATSSDTLIWEINTQGASKRRYEPNDDNDLMNTNTN
jgi:hypothetical protein